MISVILPTHNEAGNIKEVILRTVKSLKKDYEIIVVDDNSLDGTAGMVKKMRNNNHRIRLIVRRNKKGLPSALAEGIKQARGKTISFFDCDLSMPPEKLPQMIKLLAEYDLVNGSRFMKGGKDKRDFGYTKLFSLLINKLARIFIGNEITDYTGGFLVAKKNLIDEIPLKGEHGSFYIGFLYLAKKKGLKITEVPYTFSPRSSGKSKISGLDSYLRVGTIYLKKLIEISSK